jgi:predicted nuclease with TOPRIM domain
MPNKLTDTEIKKALEESISFDEPYESDFTLIRIEYIKNALDLINRYEAENTELLEKIKKLQDEYRWLDQESDILAADVNALNHFLETAKAEAYKECLDKIEQRDVSESDFYIMVKKTEFNNLLKEMGVDGKEGET